MEAKDIHPGFIVTLVDAFILGVLLVLFPSYAIYFGWLVGGAALTTIIAVLIANRKHIRRELR